jgi:hypothetical protein
LRRPTCSQYRRAVAAARSVLLLLLAFSTMFSIGLFGVREQFLGWAGAAFELITNWSNVLALVIPVLGLAFAIWQPIRLFPVTGRLGLEPGRADRLFEVSAATG